MATWPVSLPQAPEPQGYTNVERDGVMRSQLSYGPDKVRQRTMIAIRNVGMQFYLDTTDNATLDSFYTTTLSRVDSFTWIDHRNGNAATYRFKAPPAYSPFGTGLYWIVTLQLEIIV